MKIAILSRKSSLYSTRRLVEAALENNHEVDVINPLRCYMGINISKPEVHYGGRILSDYDAIIPRIGASITFYGTALVRQFEMTGVFSTSESVAITRARDKLRSLQLLAKHGIGLPITGFAHSPSDVKDLIEICGGEPLVIKLLHGTQGRGVVLAETRKAAESVIQAFYGLKENILVQEYVQEAAATDIRCFVVDGVVVAAMMRRGQDGEFRSNLHRGGTAEAVKITRKERMTAIQAAKVMGLSVAGVDILRSNNGPVVIEVNASPGLEGIETATGINVAQKIIEFIERNASKGASKTKGSG